MTLGAMKAIASKSPIDLLVDDYHQHLTDVAGLQPSTCQKWTFFVRLFLNAQFRPKAPELDLDHLKSEVLLDFVLQQGEHYRPGQLRSLASALWSFCRFLCVTGRHAQDLSAALPSISGQHREDLPTYLSRTQLKELLEGFDRRTLLGKRDYAMGLCLAQLGLRAGEVARLSLDDVDWRNGWLRLAAPKGRHERRLPLPDQVGQSKKWIPEFLGSSLRAKSLSTAPRRGDGWPEALRGERDACMRERPFNGPIAPDRGRNQTAHQIFGGHCSHAA